MTEVKTKILLIEDNPGDARLVKEMIGDGNGWDFELSHVSSLLEGFKNLDEGAYGGILLDLGLPDSIGLNTFRKLRSKNQHVPVIILSGLGDELVATQAVHEGAQDYLVKGQFESNLLIRAIRYAIERNRNEQFKIIFICNASHELRTPLSILKITISNLRRSFPESMTEQQQRMLSVAENNVDRLMRFIDNLLDLSRLEAGKSVLNRRHINLEYIICETIKNFGVEAKERGLEISEDIKPSLPEVYVDEGMIERVLNNLLSNAIHFARKRIVIGVKVLDYAECAMVPFYHCVTPPRQWLRVSVTDDGKGIQKDGIDKLFRQFYQVQKQKENHGHKGTGLGLAICKEIIEQHQGMIWAESAWGKGASFIFILPA
jgi:signal transduction histidine kinase